LDLEQTTACALQSKHIQEKALLKYVVLSRLVSGPDQAGSCYRDDDGIQLIDESLLLVV
jgi:hypothetical protein